MKSPISASGLVLLRGLDRDLREFVFDRVCDLQPALQTHFAGLAVDFGANIVFMPVFGASGLLNSLLHRDQNFVAVNSFFAGHNIGNLQQFHFLSPLVTYFTACGGFQQLIGQHQLGFSNSVERHIDHAFFGAKFDPVA